MNKDNQIQTRPLETIENEIIFYKQQTAIGIIEIGKRLNEAKQQLPHGQWGTWLKEKVYFSERTAQNFMRCSKEYDSNTYLNSDLSQSKLFLLLGIEKEKRQKFIDTTHKINGKNKKVKEMTNVELNKAIKQYKDLEDKLKEKDSEIKNIKNDIYKRKTLENVTVEFEEKIKYYGVILPSELKYNIYIVRDNVKELILEDMNDFYFIKEIPCIKQKWSQWAGFLKKDLERNKTLTKEEKDFIYGQYIIFCDSEIAKRKYKELEEARKKAQRQQILSQEESKGNEFIKKTLKKFYITLAKNYHPDRGGTDDEMKLLNQLKEQWGI